VGAPSIAEPEVADQAALPLEETEAPAPEPEKAEGENAAPEAETPAAAPRVEIDEKPEYMTRADWEREKSQVAETAARDALERERRQRQTENARKAAQEQREVSTRAELKDTIAASIISQGGIVPDGDALAVAVERAVGKSRTHITEQFAGEVEQAWDYWTGKDDNRPDSPATDLVGRRLQAFTDQIRPLIEAKAREGFTADAEVAEKVKKAVEADRAARNARAREGEEDIKRVDGSPANTSDTQTWWSSLDAAGRKDPANIARYDAYTSRR
jgi:hypothetical protein